VMAEDRVKYGLLSAARRNPLQANSEGVPGLVRGALYDTGDSPVVSKATIREVYCRTLEALQKHQHDSTTDFDRWFWGRHNTLLKQIGQQKKAPCGSLGQEQVRRALLELGWRAYWPVAACLHAMMFHFRHLLLPRLTADENRLFERTYFRQPF